MCINNEKLTFCTCSETQVKSSENYDSEIYFTWILTSYIGRKQSRIRGKMLMPSKDLGEGLTLNRILEMLNSGLSYFDFDYHPKELDCFHLSNNLEHTFYQYFSVIYKNNFWQEGRNQAFVSLTKTIAEGRILRGVAESEKTSNWLVSRDKLTVNELFDKLLSKKNNKEQRLFINALVNRFPNESYDKALYLCNLNPKIDKILGFELIGALYDSEHNFEQIKSFLFEKLKTENDKEILVKIVRSLTLKLDLLSDAEIANLISVKEKGNDLKIVLIDELKGCNHKNIIDFFIELGRDTNWGVKQKMIIDLSYEEDIDTPEIRKVLWENVENQNRKVRLHSIYGLAMRKDNNIKAILEKELQFITYDDSLILRAIKEIGDLNMIPSLELKLKKVSTNDDFARSIMSTIIRMKANA